MPIPNRACFRKRESGAYAKVTFTGESISVLARKSSNFGKLKITLDTNASIYVDLYSSTALYKQTVWSSGFLTPGAHTLKIEKSGQKNAKSTGYTVDLDAVGVLKWRGEALINVLDQLAGWYETRPPALSLDM